MRRLLALLVAACSALALASLGGASSASRYEVKVGDTLDVVGTKVACFAVDSEGKLGVGCFKVDKKGPLPGTYGGALSATGIAVLHKVNAKRQPVRILRRTASAGARYIKLRPGDVIHLQDTRVYCDVINLKATESDHPGIQVGCYLAHPAPLKGSYGVAVSDTYAELFRWTTPSRTTPVAVHEQPR